MFYAKGLKTYQFFVFVNISMTQSEPQSTCKKYLCSAESLYFLYLVLHMHST